MSGVIPDKWLLQAQDPEGNWRTYGTCDLEKDAWELARTQAGNPVPDGVNPQGGPDLRILHIVATVVQDYGRPEQ